MFIEGGDEYSHVTNFLWDVAGMNLRPLSGRVCVVSWTMDVPDSRRCAHCLCEVVTWE